MTPEQFARHLFQGTGRPFVHLRTAGPGPYLDAIRHAVVDDECLFDEGRAEYLHRLAIHAGLLPWLRQVLLEALAGDDGRASLHSLFTLAGRLAADGDGALKQAVRDRFSRNVGRGRDGGADAIVAADGLDGFLFAANCVAPRLKADGVEGYNVAGSRHILSRQGVALDDDGLRAAAGDRYPHVGRFLDYHAAEYKDLQVHTAEFLARPRIRLAVGAPYEQVREYIRTPSTHPYYADFVEWLDHAPPEELWRAAEDMPRVTEPRQLLFYLWAFRRHPCPTGPTPLLPLARHPDDRVSREAIACLSHFQDDTVRTLAFELLGGRRHLRDAVLLFEQNHRDGDEAFFARLVSSTTDDRALHELSAGLQVVYDIHPTAPAAPALLDLYERGPCPACRGALVGLLADAGVLPDDIREEALHDANEDVRRYAAGKASDGA